MISNICGEQEMKTQEEYLDDWPIYLLSPLSVCKDAVFENKIEMSALTGKPIKKIALKEKKTNKKILSTNWDEILNLVIGIKDNEYLLNVINTCKRGKTGLGYIYIESKAYISVIIKRPNSYPFVMIRIPVEQPFVYTNEKAIGSYFEFPIESLIMKENTAKSKNKQYKLYLYKDESYILKFEIAHNDDTKSRTIENIKQKQPVIINELMKATMQEYLSRFELDPITNISYSINNMNIIILKKLEQNQTPLIFEIPQNKQISYLEFKEDESLNFIMSCMDKKDEQQILTKENADLWPQVDYTGKKYVLHNYDMMFKLSHYALTSSKESIYYIFANFQNTYVFIKLITDRGISIRDKTKLYTYQDLFNTGMQVIEMYLLIEDEEII